MKREYGSPLPEIYFNTPTVLSTKGILGEHRAKNVVISPFKNRISVESNFNRYNLMFDKIEEMPSNITIQKLPEPSYLNLC